MLHWIGILLLTSSGMTIAVRGVREYERRLEVLRAGLCLVEFAAEMVENYSMPCAEILCRCDGELLRKCGWQDGTRPENFCELFGAVQLPKSRAADILEEFSQLFGKSADEAERCRRILHSLRGAVESEEAEGEKKKRVFFALTAAATFGLAILLM